MLTEVYLRPGMHTYLFIMPFFKGLCVLKREKHENVTDINVYYLSNVMKLWLKETLVSKWTGSPVPPTYQRFLEEMVYNVTLTICFYYCLYSNHHHRLMDVLTFHRNEK